MKRSYNRETIQLWLKQLRPYWLALFGVVLSGVIAESMSLVTPYGFKLLFEALSRPFAEMHLVYVAVAVILGAELVAFIFYRLQGILDAIYAPRQGATALNECYAAIMRQSHSFFEKHLSGKISRQVNQYLDGLYLIYDQTLWNLLPNVVILTGSIIILGLKDWRYAAAMISWFVIATYIIVRVSKRKQKHDKARAKADSNASGHLNDTLVNHIALRVFGAQQREANAYDRLVTTAAKEQRISWLYDVSFEGVQSFFMIILEALIILIAIRSWQHGTLVLSDLILIQGYILAIFSRFWYLSRFVRKSADALAHAEAMTKTFLATPAIIDNTESPNLKVRAGQIDIKDATFSYRPKQPVVNKLSLSIAAGEHIALVGPSGGGKSTIIKLLLRFYDLNKGTITIDGQSICDVKQDSLRRQIAYVPQEPLLFHRSILENIRYARPAATQKEVIAAAKAARAHEFIDRLPKKYRTVVGERGVRLSGGERQRVALARAFLQNAPIILLDEPTSSLDSISEKEIQRALKKLFDGRTAIVIAHRLATIKEMDRICVVERGRITEQGTHQTLNEVKRGTYQRLWEIQTRN